MINGSVTSVGPVAKSPQMYVIIKHNLLNTISSVFEKHVVLFEGTASLLGLYYYDLSPNLSIIDRYVKGPCISSLLKIYSCYFLLHH